MGRTGRGNYKGVAITLYSPEEHNISLIEDKGYHFDNVDIKMENLSQSKRTIHVINVNVKMII